MSGCRVKLLTLLQCHQGYARDENYAWGCGRHLCSQPWLIPCKALCRRKTIFTLLFATTPADPKGAQQIDTQGRLTFHIIGSLL